MPRVVDRDEKRRRIVHAAMAAFARKGIMKTKAIDIAQEAGVGKGTIYEYFRSKEEIFVAAFQLFFSNLNYNIERSLAQTDDPVQKLKIIIEETMQGFLQDEGKFAELIMEFWAEGVRSKDPAMLGAIDLKKLYADYRVFIAGVIKEGIQKGAFISVDPEVTASLVIAAIDGIGLQWIMDRGLFDPHAIAAQLFETLLQGVRKK